MSVALQPNGNIIVTAHWLSDGSGSGVETYTYKWDGGPLVALDGAWTMAFGLSRVGDRCRIGPYPVVVLDYDVLEMTVIVRRCDHPWDYLYLWGYRGTRWLNRTYRRLILTAVIWGLARCSEGAYPTWRNIHILRKLFTKGA